MTATVLLGFLGGFTLLLVGAELLVRGASRLSVALGIPPLVVGLTVVAFGTSSPEIAVSVQAVREGTADLAFGNVVGSNIANVLLVLGLAAAIAPVAVDRKLVRWDVPLMILASALVAWMAADGGIGHGDAVLLLASLAAWMVHAVRTALRDARAAREALPPGATGKAGPSATAVARDLAVAGVGFGLLLWGSGFLVDAATEVAKALGVSELVIGLTIVAVGTSLPEIATSAMAALRGERDIAVGNAVGSNLFNLLCVLGVASLAGPDGVPVNPRAMAFDLPVMVGAAFACLPVFFAGGRINRWEGFFFLACYGAYAAWLVLDARGSPLTASLRDGMLLFVLPLAAATMGVLCWREWKARRGPIAGSRGSG